MTPRPDELSDHDVLIEVRTNVKHLVEDFGTFKVDGVRRLELMEASLRRQDGAVSALRWVAAVTAGLVGTLGIDRIRRLILPVALVAALGGCGVVRAAVGLAAPTPAGAPKDATDTGLGLLEIALGTAGALGLGGPLTIAATQAVRRGRALRAVARAVEDGGNGDIKRGIAREVDPDPGARAALNAAITQARPGALGKSKGS